MLLSNARRFYLSIGGGSRFNVRRKVPTNSKVFLRGLRNIRQKQILTSVIEIQKENWGQPRIFRSYQWTIFVKSFKIQGNVWCSFPNWSLTLWRPNRPKPARLSILLCLTPDDSTRQWGTPVSQWFNDLWKMHGYPQFSFKIPRALAKFCFLRIILNRTKIS